MKKLLVIVLAVLGVAVLPATPAHADYIATYNYCTTHDTPSCDNFWAAHPPVPSVGVSIGAQDWSDEFSAPTLDTTKWNDNWFTPVNGFSDSVNSLMENCYDENNVGVIWGSLFLLGYANTNPNCQLKNSSTQAPYAGGIVTSDPSQVSEGFEFSSGVLEIEANFDDGTDCDIENWASLWTNGFDSGFGDGEIDINETGSGGDPRTNIHYGNDQVVSSSNRCGDGGSHVYTLLRTSTTCKVWVGGTLSYTDTTACAMFAGDPHAIVMDLSFDTARDTNVNQVVVIKYVRHWPLA